MATITGTYGLVKHLHLAFRTTLQSISDDVANANLLTTSGFSALAGVTTYSPLYTFLTTVYANSDAGELAFRALGGKITVRQISGTATTVIACKWTPQASTPLLNFAGGADQVLEVVISVPHSGIQ